MHSEDMIDDLTYLPDRRGLYDIYNRARQLRIYLLFLFLVEDGKLSTGVNATFNASCYS